MTTTAPALPDLRGISVLLIDDNTDFLDSVDLIFQEAGARTTPVSSLALARTALDRSVPDVIVSDLVLGDGTGVEFVEWLRERPMDRGGGVAVLAVTAFPHYFPAVSTRGFAAYLAKPVDLAVLCWTVASVLGRGTGRPA